MTKEKASAVLTRRLVYVEERLKLSKDSDHTCGYLARERDALYIALESLGVRIDRDLESRCRGGAKKEVIKDKMTRSCVRCPLHGKSAKKPEAA